LQQRLTSFRAQRDWTETDEFGNLIVSGNVQVRRRAAPRSSRALHSYLWGKCGGLCGCGVVLAYLWRGVCFAGAA
jgi:hypothetical protein